MKLPQPIPDSLAERLKRIKRRLVMKERIGGEMGECHSSPLQSSKKAKTLEKN
jgi:hypothetical protein